MNGIGNCICTLVYPLLQPSVPSYTRKFGTLENIIQLKIGVNWQSESFIYKSIRLHIPYWASQIVYEMTALSYCICL